MSDEERSRILRMVSEGKLSPEEAADLLEAVEPSPEPEARFVPTHPGMPGEMHGHRHRRRNRYLVIQIREGGDNKVNLRIPLGLTRAAGKFIPKKATDYLGKYEIDLNEFLAEVADTEGGTLLEIKDGNDKVLIAVE